MFLNDGFPSGCGAWVTRPQRPLDKLKAEV
jgi:hypothetical protein